MTMNLLSEDEGTARTKQACKTSKRYSLKLKPHRGWLRPRGNRNNGYMSWEDQRNALSPWPNKRGTESYVSFKNRLGSSDVPVLNTNIDSRSMCHAITNCTTETFIHSLMVEAAEASEVGHQNGSILIIHMTNELSLMTPKTDIHKEVWDDTSLFHNRGELHAGEGWKDGGGGREWNIRGHTKQQSSLALLPSTHKKGTFTEQGQPSTPCRRVGPASTCGSIKFSETALPHRLRWSAFLNFSLGPFIAGAAAMASLTEDQYWLALSQNEEKKTGSFILLFGDTFHQRNPLEGAQDDWQHKDSPIHTGAAGLAIHTEDQSFLAPLQNKAKKKDVLGLFFSAWRWGGQVVTWLRYLL